MNRLLGVAPSVANPIFQLYTMCVEIARHKALAVTATWLKLVAQSPASRLEAFAPSLL